jgi:DnaJ homolog subfamily C member 9
MAPRARRRRERPDDDEDITVDDAPTSIDPYVILSLEKEATQDEIKSAYRRAALKHHPDKAADTDKDAAHAKFQEVAFAYAILSDERRRKRYDTTGRTEESIEDDEDFSWTDFFREQYASVVTTDTIRAFESEYKGSEEERGHVLAAYVKYDGDMDRLYQEVMLSDPEQDDERFRMMIEKAIESGEVEGLEKFTGESEKKRLARINRAKKMNQREAKEAEKAEREIEEDLDNASKRKKGGKATANGGGMGDLAALIQQRQKGRAENFFDNLEAKYAPKGKGGSKRVVMDEPSEEAFAKNRKKTKT